MELMIDTEIISAHEIYLQSVICDAVYNNPDKDDVTIYEIIAKSDVIDIEDIERVGKILELIKMNKHILRLDF